MTNFSKSVGVCAFVLAAGCGVTDDRNQKTEVTEPNDLGVTALQTTRVLNDGNDVLTIQAFSADDQEVASVRLTIGDIPDLPPADDNRGSELVVSIAGGDSIRTISRQINHWTFQPIGSSARVLGLTAVASVLEREANVVVLTRTPALTAEAPYLLVEAFTEQSCPPGDLNGPPKAPAGQACLGTESISGLAAFRSIFQVVTATGVIAQRNQNLVGPGAPCMDYGGGSCSGTACTFGPNGWETPTMTSPPSGKYPLIQVVNEYESNFVEYITGDWCDGTFVSSPPTPTFPTVPGTFSTGCGCCGDETGLCCGSACAACSTTKSAGAGAWDI
jgi:hypothetical protein